MWPWGQRALGLSPGFLRKGAQECGREGAGGRQEAGGNRQRTVQSGRCRPRLQTPRAAWSVQGDGSWGAPGREAGGRRLQSRAEVQTRWGNPQTLSPGKCICAHTYNKQEIISGRFLHLLDSMSFR